MPTYPDIPLAVLHEDADLIVLDIMLEGEAAEKGAHRLDDAGRAELRVYHAPDAAAAQTRALHIAGIARLTPALGREVELRVRVPVADHGLYAPGLGVERDEREVGIVGRSGSKYTVYIGGDRVDLVLHRVEDLTTAAPALSGAACLIVQNPNFLGYLEAMPVLAEAAHAARLAAYRRRVGLTDDQAALGTAPTAEGGCCSTRVRSPKLCGQKNSVVTPESSRM